MLIWSIGKKGHNLNIEWQEPMKLINAKSERIFEVENLTESERMTAHGQRMVPYPVLHHTSQITGKLMKQSNHLASTYHMVKEISGARQSDRIIELHVKWIGWEDIEKTWEPLGNKHQDVPIWLKTSCNPAVTKIWCGLFSNYIID